MQSDLALILHRWTERWCSGETRQCGNGRNLPAPSFFPNHIIKPTYEEIERVIHRRRLGISFDILVFLKNTTLEELVTQVTPLETTLSIVKSNNAKEKLGEIRDSLHIFEPITPSPLTAS